MTVTAGRWGTGRDALSEFTRGRHDGTRRFATIVARRNRTGHGALPRPMVAVGAAGIAITALVSLAPFVRFAYRNPAAHVAIDTTSTIVALLTALLLFERYRQTALRRDLLLTAAMAVMAAASLGLSAGPALAGLGFEPALAWARFTTRLLGAALLAAACFVPPRRLRAPTASARHTLVACGAALVGLALLALLLNPWLPLPIDPALSPVVAGRPRILGNPIILGGQLVGMVLFASAAVGFARNAATARDDLVSWVAIGSLLAAFGRLNYFLFPSQYTDFVYTGDLFVLASCIVLLVGAARQIRAYHRELAEKAVLEERRRIARDLHDGMAQDLAFIVAQSRNRRAADHLDQLASAAERALDDSRQAIAALTCPLDEPVDHALARVAGEVSERLGARADLDLEAGVKAPAPLREALLRIAREAMNNAVRHGGARTIAISLARLDDMRMTVADDGCGFDTSAPPRRARGGFGLISMRERAEAVGGALAVSSAPGKGTTIEVVVPCPAN